MSIEGIEHPGDIATPWGVLRRTVRDGELVWKLKCPQCHHWGDIDDDQLHGRVSLDHTNCGIAYAPSECQCTWHETHDYTAFLSLLDEIGERRNDEAFMERLRWRVAEDRPLLDALRDAEADEEGAG